MIEATDQALIQRVVTLNCHDSFNVLVKRHQSTLCYSLQQMTGWDQSVADYLAQETFIKAYTSITPFKGTVKFSSWLYRIAYNVMISHFRVARNRELTLGDDGTHFTESSVSFNSNNQHRDLAGVILKLAPQQRMALHLHYFPAAELLNQIPRQVMITPQFIASLGGVAAAISGLIYWKCEADLDF